VLETLAIVAYRQPITRPEIEQLRGVDSGGVLETLVERNLIKMAGRKDAPGRPIMYTTTADFLELFGLKDLESLPDLEEFRELERLRAPDPAADAGHPDAESAPVEAPPATEAVAQGPSDDSTGETATGQANEVSGEANIANTAPGGAEASRAEAADRRRKATPGCAE
jgi:segregation and condensation protein B